MTDKKQIIAAATTMFGALAIASSASALDLTQISGAKDDTAQYYGIADYRTGTVQMSETSAGATTIPAEERLTDPAAIAGMKAAAHADNAVMSSQGNVIGTIEKVETHKDYDTIYVRTSPKLDTTVSMFKVNVSKSAAMDGKVKLGWTVSELLTTLEKQVDMRS